MSQKRGLNSFTINGTNITIRANDCVTLRPTTFNEDAYIARVIAINEKKAKIQWYYRPEETELGRKTFHGKKEVLLSNHYDVQSTSSIQGKCVVHSWEDYIKLKVAREDDYFSRFEYDAVNKRIIEVAVPVYCECNMPHNPDICMVQCDGCKQWFHPECKNMAVGAARKLKNKKYFCSKKCSKGASKN